MSLMALHLGIKSTTGKNKMNDIQRSFVPVLGVILLNECHGFAFGDEFYNWEE